MFEGLKRWAQRHGAKAGMVCLVIGAICANTSLGLVGLPPMLIGAALVFVSISHSH
jgi:hypothetical protein